MKVLVVGGGGREHAICWKLAQSPKVTELYCAPGNGGIAQVAQCVPIKATDVEAMVAWAKEHAMDFVMVAPDDPLALGMVDALEAAGIPATVIGSVIPGTARRMSHGGESAGFLERPQPDEYDKICGDERQT